MSARETVEILDHQLNQDYKKDDSCRVDVFKVLADPNRLKILHLLVDGERCVSDLLPHLDILQPTVSVHLHQLLGIGLLNIRKTGRYRYYSLTDDGLVELIDRFFDKIEVMVNRARRYGPEPR